MQLDIYGHTFHLLPEKAVFWADRSTLLISDVHLGKVMHFRKEGIAIPDIALVRNFEQLENLIFLTNADRVIFLGDLFHNTLNVEWDFFAGWRRQFQQLQLCVVRGNHDILPDDLFASLQIEVAEEPLTEEEFLFLHHPLEQEQPGYFAFAGHLHPVFRIHARGRQTLRLPCFIVDPGQMILPGFGVFTGGHEMRPAADRSVFVVGADKVFRVG